MQRGPNGDYVSRGWEGETVVCIASGPSLSKEQLEISRRFKSIVINDNYLVAPWADICYFADHKWWKWHIEGLEKSWPWVKFTKEEVKKAFSEFKGQLVSIKHNPQAGDSRVFILDNDGGDGLSERQNGIRTGSNSGYQALNIAVLSGAKTILLIGYDMRFQGSRSHAHNGHPMKTAEFAYNNYAKRFGSMVKQLRDMKVRVVNCSPESKIDAFEKGKIESFESTKPVEASAVVSEASV